MPRLGFAIDNRACIGCHACTIACKSEHEVPLGVNRTWVKYIEKGEFPQNRRFFNVQRCNHCADAPCVDICPVTALYTRPDGIVDFDNYRCIGCKACMQACPYDALYLDPESNTAAKCNYCTHRVDAGIEPACVVVCPVQAIVSGDLDDPNSRIAQLDRLQKVQYPKVEKGTNPKLFYIGGEAAALDPNAAPPGQNYLWSGNDGRISLPQLRKAGDEAEQEARARRVYDAAAKPAPWGWMVSAYITTKAISTGIVLAAVGLFASGRLPSVLPTAGALLALLFLALTGGFLVGDLKRPERFLYVLLRPQWNSWLVRGAYLILGFSLLLPIAWLCAAVDAARGLQLALGWSLFALAGATAAYTALLLAQAKGRDYWQNSLHIVTMLVDAAVCGLAVAVGLGWLNQTDRNLLLGSVILLSVLQLAEHLPRHPSQNAARAAAVIVRGSLAPWFWIGVVGSGLLLPLAVLVADGPVQLATVPLVIGIAVKNHVLVQAPQRVPLS